MAGEMSALNRQPTAKGSGNKKEDKVATATEAAEVLERKLNKVLISKEAMKENIGHTASMGVDMAITVGSAAASSTMVGITPPQHRNKVRVARGLTAVLLTVKGLHSGLKYGTGQHYMAAANGLAAAEASESALAFGEKLRAKWAGSGAEPQPAVQPPAAVQPPPAVQQPAIQQFAAHQPAIAMTPIQGVGEVREIVPDDPALAAFRANGRAAAHRRG
jgi:hypothetical protein